MNPAGGPPSIFAASQAESSHSIPSPAQNSDLSPTPPFGGFTRTAPRNQGRVIGFGIHVSALRTAPRSPGLLGFSGWRACSRARNSCLRSSGKGPSKQWPLRVPRASSLPVSQPASHCQGNDLVRELGTLESSPFSCLRPRILTGGLRQLGQGAWTMSVIPGISHWNMGNIRLGEEEAVEKGQKFFGGEQHSHRLHTSLSFLRVGGVTRVCTCLKTFSAIAKLIGQGGKTVVDLRC